MAPLHVLILSTLPFCLAQFSIQGPSDGNRAAQSLRYSEEKGIEYSDQSASLGTGDFSIQGATDGNSNFQIQGASDGNSDFQIQGATDGNADFRIQGASDGNANFHIQGASDGNANFQIQGATDGNANFQIQGATDGQANYQVQEPSTGNEQSSIQLGQYDPNQGNHRSLQYNDQNGFKINWKSYAHGQLSPQPHHHQQQQQQQPRTDPVQYTQSHAEAQYATQPAPRPAPQPAPRPTHQGEERVSVQQPISYRPYDNAPAQIKQLLQFQSQIPYLNAIPEHLRYDAIAHAQPQTLPQEQPQEDSPPPRYRPNPRGHQRPKRQAQKQQGQQQATPQYSTNVPSQIQQLLSFQSQIPYQNAIPEQFRYNLDTPPAPVQPFKTEVPLQNPPRLGHARSKRQAHQQQRHNQQQQQQQQQQPQQQYRRIPQPAPEAQPHYSTNVPSQIQQLLRFQSQIPYMNAIPEQFRYNLDNVPAPNPQQGAAHHRGKRQAQHQQKPQQQYKRIPQPAPESQPRYSTNVPPQIKQLLQFQSHIPYVNAIPEQFRYNLENVQHAPQNGAQSHQRGKREAQQHLNGQNQQQYRRIPQPAPEALPQYSANLPSDIQQILKFQAETPYNIIANQIIYRPDKPYVPQPVSRPVPNYQAQNQGNIKPVTERQ